MALDPGGFVSGGIAHSLPFCFREESALYPLMWVRAQVIKSTALPDSTASASLYSKLHPHTHTLTDARSHPPSLTEVPCNAAPWGESSAPSVHPGRLAQAQRVAGTSKCWANEQTPS